MSKKEQEKEDKEIRQAVKVLRATIHSIARRKAVRFEAEFMSRVREMIDIEMRDDRTIQEYLAKNIGKEVEDEILA